MGGCASSKTAEDKDDMAKARSTKANMKQNGKTKASPNANTMSGSLSTPNNAGGQQSATAQAGIRQNSINSNLATANNYLNNNNNNNTNSNLNAGNSLIESNNQILLTEFFKAVGNGELEKLKQILLNVDEINASLNQVWMILKY